ncbi:hypothetical protein L208DRAFT_1532029 [Tricholoma matsutake]|nr:hypothetical protein L208DRAFT_1532029 [Tricholoma matsutake 945]
MSRTQQAGRGGHNNHIHAWAILLVQPSIFQELKPVKGIKPEDGEVKYRKDVEADLCEWIETDGCHRNTSAIYFNDGVPQKHSQQESVVTIASSNQILITHSLQDPILPLTIQSL